MLKYLSRLSSRSPQPLSVDKERVDEDDGHSHGDHEDDEDVDDGDHEDNEDVEDVDDENHEDDDDGALGGGHLAQVSHQLAHHRTGGRRDAGQTCRQ